MPTRDPPDFPVYRTSSFAADGGGFCFDIARLEGQPGVPRSFPHRHDYYHLLWLSEAAGTHLLDFQRHAARANTAFLVAPGQLHAWESAIAPRGFIVNFSTDFLSPAHGGADGAPMPLPILDAAAARPAIRMAQAQHDALQPLLQEMEREFLDAAPGRMQVIHAYLFVLLTRLGRLHAPEPGPEAPAADAALCGRFRALAEARFLEFAQVRDYAAALGVSERRLGQAVRRTLGKTAGQFVQDRVLLEAKRLLGNPALSVAEIAFRLRFEDHAYFSRFFRRRAGASPTEFRRRHAGLLRSPGKP